MKVMTLSLVLVLTAGSAFAQGMPSTSQQTCAANRALVKKDGALTLDDGTAGYHRFVKNGSECMIDEFPEPAWVKSSDKPQCFIGYRCLNNDD